MKRPFAFIPLLAAAAAACATIAPARPPTGQWGGEHVGLMLTLSGGTLDYDCAAGRIDGPLTIQPDGRFKATGSHTPGTGGPEQVGAVRPSYPAQYFGTLRGDRMTLSGRVANGMLLGPFELRRGAQPNLLRCL